MSRIHCRHWPFYSMPSWTLHSKPQTLLLHIKAPCCKSDGALVKPWSHKHRWFKTRCRSRAVHSFLQTAGDKGESFITYLQNRLCRHGMWLSSPLWRRVNPVAVIHWPRKKGKLLWGLRLLIYEKRNRRDDLWNRDKRFARKPRWPLAILLKILQLNYWRCRKSVLDVIHSIIQASICFGTPYGHKYTKPGFFFSSPASEKFGYQRVSVITCLLVWSLDRKE